MADGNDPLAMLAPNAAPDWTPPQPGTPGAAPATGTPTEPTPPVTVSTGAPSPVDTINSPQLTAMLPHESWLHRALNATVNQLAGGDQTYQLAPQPDGTVLVKPHPSTAGEKWGRIAATVLAGAAKGMAVGQGPGGAARAVSAGFDLGSQQQQQQLANLNAQAASMNKQQLDAANNAFLHQKMVIAGLQANELGIKVGQDTADLMNRMFDATKDSPNAQVLPSVGSMAEIAKLQNSYADFFKTHTNNTMKVFATPDANGKIRFTPVIVDVAYNDRKNDKVMQVPKLGQPDPSTGEPTLDYDNVPVGAQPMTQITASQQAGIAKYLDIHNKWMTASGANKPDKVPTTPQQAQAMADLETDPTRKAALLATIPQMQRLELQQRAASRAPAAAPFPTLAPGGGGGGGGTTPTEPVLASDGTPQPSAEGANLLSRLDPGTAALVRQVGEYRGSESTLPRGKERTPFLQLVAQVYPGFDEKQYTSRQKLLTDMKTGNLAQARQSINTAISHIGDLYDATVALDPSEAKVANTAANLARSQGLGDSYHLGKFTTAANGVSSELARAFKGTGAGTQTETNEWRAGLSADNPKSMQYASISEALKMLSGRLGAAQDTIKTGMGTSQTIPMLTPQSIRTLSRIPGGEEVVRDYGLQAAGSAPNANAPASTAPPANATPTPTVPPGKFPVRVGGKVVGYGDDAKGANYHAF